MMLSPSYLEHAPDALTLLWQQVEDDILRDVARRISKMETLTETANWQLWRYQQTEALRQDVVKKLARYTGKSEAAIRQLMQEAATRALEAEDAIYYHYDMEPTPFEDNAALQALLNAGYQQTAGTFRNLTGTTANTVSGQFEAALDRAQLKVSTGAFDYKSAVKSAVDSLADGMKYITYPTGHKDTLEVACRRAVLTGVNQTAAKLQVARADEMGVEFFSVTAHGGARPTHEVWQGKTYHRGGAVDYLGQHYEDFESSTGYGTGGGLCGWNCRHTFFAVFPELGPAPTWTQESLDALNARDIEYNGGKYTQYEISQMQRARERTVRKYKRRYLAETEAGVDATDSAVKLRAARAELADFAAKTGGRVDSARVSVAGFGRSASGKAAWAAKDDDQHAAENQFRKNRNNGVFSVFDEPMNLKHVRRVSRDMGIEMKDAKWYIVRDKELAERPEFMGYTLADGSGIQLYPAAFTNREQLVKTMGHEYIHLQQTWQRGKIDSTEELMLREREAYGSEEKWWNDYCKKTGYSK